MVDLQNLTDISLFKDTIVMIFFMGSYHFFQIYETRQVVEKTPYLPIFVKNSF